MALETNLFQLHAVTDMGSAAEFNEWLSEQVRLNQPVAIAIKGRAQKLALSSRDDAWLIDMKPHISDLPLAMIGTQLRTGLQFMMRDAANDIVELTRRLSKRLNMDEPTLLNLIIDATDGDLTQASVCINQIVTPHTKFAKVEHDAFDIALNLPQFVYAIPPYYGKVGLPLARCVAESSCLRPSNVDWWVSYPDLWVRVLAYFAHDPTLILTFTENRDPFEVVAAMFQWTKEAAETMLLWCACGCDLQVFTDMFPRRSKELPSALQVYNNEIQKHLPVLFQSVHQMKEAYYSSRLAETRYGRRMRPGKPLGAAVSHRIFGSVEDIIAVATVAIWNNRPSPDILITKIEGGPSETNIRISGTSPTAGGQTAWMNLLSKLAPLTEPLGQVKLYPSVVQP